MSSQWQRWKGIMKAVPFEEKRLLKWRPPFIVQPKYDGDRCKAYPLESGYLMLSSEENPFYSVPHIQDALTSSGIKMTLDGELYNHSIHKGGGHEAVHSIVSRTVNIHPRYQEMQYHIFDVETDEPQLKRLVHLENIKKMQIPYIVVAPFWLCETLDDIMRVYDELMDKDYEGIIVRHIDNVYQHKRSTLLMKFKPKQEDIYEIIGFNEEIDKNGYPKGTLGSLVCRSQEGESFAVGSGFRQDDRRSLWIAKESLIGRRVKVQYQHTTPGRGVPRFPIFASLEPITYEEVRR